MSRTDYRSLGRSGPIVSPLALGTMTFGTPRWGVPDRVSKAIFNTYVEAGGNSIDTALRTRAPQTRAWVGGHRVAAEERSSRQTARDRCWRYTDGWGCGQDAPARTRRASAKEGTRVSPQAL